MYTAHESGDGREAEGFTRPGKQAGGRAGGEGGRRAAGEDVGSRQKRQSNWPDVGKKTD